MRVSDAFRDPLVIDPVERPVELGVEEAKLVHLLPKTELPPPTTRSGAALASLPRPCSDRPYDRLEADGLDRGGRP